MHQEERLGRRLSNHITTFIRLRQKLMASSVDAADFGSGGRVGGGAHSRRSSSQAGSSSSQAGSTYSSAAEEEAGAAAAAAQRSGSLRPDTPFEGQCRELRDALGASPCGAFWSDAGADHAFQIRGPSYLYDRVKVPAGTSVCPLVWFDLFTVPDDVGSRVDHISSQGACARRVEQLTAGANPPFLFITAIQVPGTPVLYMVMYWAVDPALLQLPGQGGAAAAAAGSSGSGGDSGGGGGGDAEDSWSTSGARSCVGLLQQYLSIPIQQQQGPEGTLKAPVGSSPQLRTRSADVTASATAAVSECSDADGDGGTASGFLQAFARSSSISLSPTPRRSKSADAGVGADGFMRDSYAFHNSRFKLIPQIVDGPWVVRKTVGAVPCLLGTKVTTRFYRGERYVETNVEVGSSTVAQRIIGCCRGYSGRIDVQLGIVLQGEEVHELPEQLLGAVRFRWFSVDEPSGQVPLYP